MRRKDFQEALNILNLINTSQAINNLSIQNQKNLKHVLISTKLICYVALKNIKEMLNIYEKYFPEESPDKYYTNYFEFLTMAMEYTGLLIKEGNYNTAETFLINQISQISSNKADYLCVKDNISNISKLNPQILAEFYIQLFVCYFNLKDEEKSVQVINKILLLYPKNAFAKSIKDVLKIKTDFNQTIENPSQSTSPDSCQSDHKNASILINISSMQNSDENLPSEKGNYIITII